MDVPIAKACVGCFGDTPDTGQWRTARIAPRGDVPDVGQWRPTRWRGRVNPMVSKPMLSRSFALRGLGALEDNALTEGGMADPITFDEVTIYGKTDKPLPGSLTPGGAVVMAATAAASGALIPGVIGGVLWAMKKKDGAKVAFIVAGIFAAISASGAVVAGQSLADQGKLRF